MSGDSSLHWKKIFLQTMDESDREKLRQLVPKAESAIFIRREELGNSVEAREELSTMAVAIAALCSIRIHELGGTDSARATQSDSGTGAST
jgi:hypothetical protein